MIIYLFGDSITQGYSDSKGGWADRVRAEVFRRDVESDKKYYHGVHNLGIDGNTTSQVLDRFDPETQARFWKNSEYGIVFAIGTNDTVINNAGEYDSDNDTYRYQLEKLYEKALQITDKIAFVNLLPVDEKLTNPLPNSSTGKIYTNERLEIFNNVLEEFSKTKEIELIDVRSKYLASNYEILFADGLHPNDAGHELIYQTVMPVLEKWLYPRS